MADEATASMAAMAIDVEGRLEKALEKADEASDANYGACANCHRIPAAGEKAFSACTKCVEQKLKPALYCSRECQKENWPAHKKWHKGIAELLATQAIRSNGDDGPEKQAARHVEYSSLVKQGLRECADGNRQRGAEIFQQCIALRPEQPVAYANLGYMLRDAGDFCSALPALLKAVELFEEGSEQWGTTAAVAWFAYSADSILCDEVPNLPAWITTLAPRLEMAERCAACAPGSMQCQAMLGMALAESELDLGRAAQCLMKAARLTDQEQTKKGYLEFARALLVQMKEQAKKKADEGGAADVT